ncbi:ankyrin repeat-containing domain protein [Amanita rubescens]|nr:ankyrin repeat-containing domain protein [Amanita rubescens]
MLKPLFEPENNGKQLTSYEFLDDEDYSTHIREPESPLVYAALLGAVKIVKWLLETDWEANVVDLDLNKALLAASHIGYIDIVILLLDHGADVHATHEQDNTSAFQYGVYKKHLNILQLLLKRGVDVNQKGWRGGTALHSGAMYGHSEIIQFLIRNGAEINIFDQRGLTPLHCASSCGHNASVVQLLIYEGADPNLGSNNFSCGAPLHQASFHGNTQVVQCLLDNGADVDLYSEELGTPLQAACLEGHFQLVKLLIERGADVNMVGGSRLGNALHAAICGNHVDIASYLIEKGAHVLLGMNHLQNAVSKGNLQYHPKLDASNALNWALADASFNGNIELVRILLEKYNVDANGLEGIAVINASLNGHLEVLKVLEAAGGMSSGCEGALQVAAYMGRQDTLEHLLEHRSFDVNHCESNDHTALEDALIGGYPEIAKMLIEKGADVNGSEGMALEMAARRGYADVVKMMIERGAAMNGVKYALEQGVNEGWVDVVKVLLDARKDLIGDEELRRALRVARQKGYTELVEMLEREVGYGTDDAAKDEEPAKQLIKQGAMVEKGAIRNADGDEGATETFANGGMALAGLGLLACTFALFYLRRRGTQSE